MRLRDWLAGLSEVELERLAAALASGRLAPGASVAMLKAVGLPGVWAGALGALGEAGWTAPTLAEAVALAMQARGARGTRIEVISTHPGAASSGLMETAVVLRQLFQQARCEVRIAGFRITDRGLLEHLRRREAEALDVGLFLHFGQGTNAWGFSRGAADSAYEDSPQGCWRQFVERIWPEAMDAPRGWFAPSIFSSSGSGIASMHVKAAVVDRRRVFISSANFTQAAQHRNVELGVLFDEAQVAERVLRHFDGLVRDGVFVAC